VRSKRRTTGARKGIEGKQETPIGIRAGGETCSVHHFEIAGIAMWFKKTEASHRFGCTLHRDHARLRGGPPSSLLQPKLDVPRLQAISEKRLAGTRTMAICPCFSVSIQPNTQSVLDV
jgi:hypothetical protein